MEHPVFYVTRVTRFLDSLIREHGDYLFVGFCYLSIVFLIWMFVCRRKRPVTPTSSVILVLGMWCRRQEEQEPRVWSGSDDFDRTD